MNSVGAERGNVHWKLAGVGLAVCVSGCWLDNPGPALPKGELAYPIALGTSSELNAAGAPKYLYVANANFDLRYNAGNIQSYDLDALSAQLVASRCRCDAEDDACRSRGVAEVTLSEARTLDAGVVLVTLGDQDAGESDAGESDAGESDAGESDAGESDAGESDAGESDAGESDAGESDAGADAITLPEGFDARSQFGEARGILCDGRDATEDTVCCFDSRSRLDPLRKSEIVIDSYANGLALSPSGGRIYVPLRSRNRLLYVDVADGTLSCGSTPADARCERGPDMGDGSASGAAPAAQAAAIVAGELAQLGVEGTQADFIATSHEYGQLSLYTDDGRGPRLQDVLTSAVQRSLSLSLDDTRHLLMVNSVASSAVDQVGVESRAGVLRLARSAALAISDVTPATDVRQIIVDPEDSGRFMALVRGPSTSNEQVVAFYERDPREQSGARLLDAVRVGAGPAKMVLATVDGQRLLFAACNDGKGIYVVDADKHTLVSVVRELNGPFEMQVDAVRGLLYVADFRASVVRVVDIRGIVDRTRPPPRVVATLGKPYFGGGLK
jgi:DNA-binding beta-propeller fold protein YncE